jgi:hypothetical protein
LIQADALEQESQILSPLSLLMFHPTREGMPRNYLILADPEKSSLCNDQGLILQGLPEGPADPESPEPQE